MENDSSSLQGECSHASFVPHSHHSWEDSLITHFCQCLILKKASEYSHVAKTFQPMTLIIPLENIVVPWANYTPLLLTLSLHLFFTISLITLLSWINFSLPKF
jgi:hypothetical protein